MPVVPGEPGVGGGTPQEIWWRYGAPAPSDPDAATGSLALVQRWTSSGPRLDLATWADPSDATAGDPDQILRWAPISVQGGYPVRWCRLIAQSSQVVRWGGSRPPAPPLNRVMAYVQVPTRLVFVQVPAT